MKISRRQFVQVLAVAGASALLTACGGSSNNSAAGSTAASGAAAAAGGSFNLKLGHNLAEDHAVHIQLTSFAEQVKEKTNGTVNIQIIPNGTLGSESDMISQIQAGALDMAKVSASTLGNFSEKYNAFSVPYVFDDQAHYYTYMDSDSAQAVFESTDDQGFRGLTWLDSGARSFYTKATAIRTPADLKGLKIRTMDSQMAVMIPKGSLLPANPERFAKVLAKETGKDWQQPKSLWGLNLKDLIQMVKDRFHRGES